MNHPLQLRKVERLATLGKAAGLPPYPGADGKGRLPAKQFLRVSIARDIIKDRVAAGLSQKELVKRADIRVETLCRIETGKHTPSVATIDKIDRALRKATVRKS